MVTRSGSRSGCQVQGTRVGGSVSGGGGQGQGEWSRSGVRWSVGFSGGGEVGDK